MLHRDGEALARDEDSAAYRLLAVAPNELMTSKEFWRWKQLTEDVRGNAFARIVWKRGVPETLWPLYGQKPQLKVDAASGRVAWQYSGDDFTPPDAYPLQDLLHFKGPVLTSPFEGRSLIDLASETIGVNIGSEQFFARLLGNGSHFPGYLETDNTLTQEDVDALRQQLAGFSGVLQAMLRRPHLAARLGLTRRTGDPVLFNDHLTSSLARLLKREHGIPFSFRQARVDGWRAPTCS